MLSIGVTVVWLLTDLWPRRRAASDRFEPLLPWRASDEIPRENEGKLVRRGFGGAMRALETPLSEFVQPTIKVQNEGNPSASTRRLSYKIADIVIGIQEVLGCGGLRVGFREDRQVEKPS